MRAIHGPALIAAGFLLGVTALSVSSPGRAPDVAPAMTLQVDSLDTHRLLEIGRQVYVDWCADCHGVDWEGGMAGSLSDEEWMYVTDETTPEQIIRAGIDEEGMPAWEDILSEDEIKGVLTLIEARRAEAGDNR